MNFDFVVCMGHFLRKDENIYTFFEGRALLAESASASSRANAEPRQPSGISAAFARHLDLDGGQSHSAPTSPRSVSVWMCLTNRALHCMHSPCVHLIL